MTKTETQNSVLAIIAKFEKILQDIGYVNPKFYVDINPSKIFSPYSISLSFTSITNFVELQKSVLKNKPAFETDLKHDLFKELHAFYVIHNMIEGMFDLEGQIVLTPVDGLMYWSDTEFTNQLSGIVSIPTGYDITVYVTDEEKTIVGLSSLVNGVEMTEEIELTIVEGLTAIIVGVYTAV